MWTDLRRDPSKTPQFRAMWTDLKPPYNPFKIDPQNEACGLTLGNAHFWSAPFGGKTPLVYSF